MPTDPLLVELVDYASARLPELVEMHVERMLGDIEVYRGDVVNREDVRRSVDQNMRYLLLAMRDPEARRDFAAPRETGRRRATQGIPLPEVLRAYRTGLAALWNALTEHAARSKDPRMIHTVIVAARLVWELTDEYAIELTESYRTTTADLLISQQHRRSALAEALFTGAPGPDAGPWEVSKLLGIPPDGDLMVIAAETSGTAVEGLPRIETLLRERGLTSAWRLTPALQMGVVSVRPAQYDDVVDLLRTMAKARVGVSPVFGAFSEVPRALQLARVAMSGLPPGRVAVSVFSANPLAALVAQHMDEGKRIVGRVFGPVLELPSEDRAILLETLRSWFDCAGSAEQAAERLYCHPNTVRYRLRRLQELTGRSLSEPYGVADLATALQAITLDPPI